MQMQDDSGSLLSSRLNNKGQTKKSETIDVGRLRKKDAERDSAPVYSQEPDYADIFEEETTRKHKKLSRVKPEKSTEKKRGGLLRDTLREDSAPSLDEPSDVMSYDELLEVEGLKQEHRKARNRVILARATRVILSLLIVICCYLAFLIYGLIQTSYIYDDTGAVVPEILSVEDLRTLDQYETLSGYYLRTRILYEDVLRVDYSLASDSSKATIIAMDYTELLDDVSKLATDISAAELDTGYAGMMNQMYTLVYTHIAVYLQNMAGALTTNDANKADQALQGREVIKSEFTLITSNMAALCDATNGAKNGDIYSWSPDSFMLSLAEGGA